MNQFENALSPFVDVQIAVEDIDAYDTLFPAPGLYENRYKKNSTISLAVTVSENYSFIGWKADSDAVYFKNAASAETTATIINDKNPIKITPLFVYHNNPKITEIYPIIDSSIIWEQNTNIEILFDTEINPELFTDSENLFKNISITAGTRKNKNLLENKEYYFWAPEFSVEKNVTKMIIRPNQYGITELFSDNVEKEIINVTLYLQGMNINGTEEEPDEFGFYSNECFDKDYSFSYYITNKNKKTEPLSFVHKLNMFINEQDANTFIKSTESGDYSINAVYGFTSNGDFVNKEGTLNENPEKKENAIIGGKVWINAKIKDKDKALNKVVLKEQNVISSSLYDRGPLLTEEYLPSDKQLTYDSNNNEYIFLEEYEVKTQENDLLNFIIEFYDIFGNVISDGYYVVKDSRLPLVNIYRTEPELTGEKQSEVVKIVTCFDEAESQLEYPSATTYSVSFSGNMVSSLYYFPYHKAHVEKKYTDNEIPLYEENDSIWRIDSISYSYDGNNYTNIKNFTQDCLRSIEEGYQINTVKYIPCGIVEFERDCTKDCHIKVCYSDKYGNKGEKTEVIQANMKIVEASILDDSLTFTVSKKPEEAFYLYKKFNAKNTDTSERAPAVIEGTEIEPVFKNKNLINEAEVNFNEITQTVDFETQEGRYDLYVLPALYYYSDRFRPSASSSTITNPLKHHALNGWDFVNSQDYEEGTLWLYFLCGNLGKPFSVYVGVEKEELDIPDEVKPKSITLTADPILNNEQHRLTVNLPSDYQMNPDYIIKYEINDLTNGNIYYSYENTITVPSYHKYKADCYVINKNGNLELACESEEIETNDDTTSPQWPDEIEFEEVLETYHNFIKTFPIEEEDESTYQSGLEVCQEGIHKGQNIIYYFISQNQINNLTEEEFFKQNYFKTYFDSNDESGKIEIFTNGNIGSYIYLLVKDKNGNSSITKVYIKYVYGIYPAPTFSKSSTKTAYLVNNIDYRNGIWFQSYDSINQKWNEPEVKQNLAYYYSADSISNGNTFEFKISSYANTFVRVSHDKYFYVDGNGNRTEYIKDIELTKRYFKPDVVAEGKKDTLANVVQGNYGYTILAEYPTFAHILFCEKDLGTKPETWETHGIEYNPYYSNTNYTYKIKDLPKEEGYYILAVYFADGETKWYSPVMKNTVEEDN